jgi:hypothetical protein
MTDPSLGDSEPSVSRSKTTGTTFDRVQRARHRMGTHRWNLMVALGLVSKIEREMLQAEYESWVYAEAGRCRQIKKLNSRTQKVEWKDFDKWWNEYCVSCLATADGIGFR